MTKRMIIAAVSVVVLVIGSVFMWLIVTTSHEAAEIDMPIETVIVPTDDELEYQADTVDEDLDYDITRIIIDSDDQGREEIEAIISKKIIVNDEVKDEDSIKRNSSL